VSTDTMETWKNSEISGDLTQVPGIGPATASKLAGEGITNVRELCRILSPVLGGFF
jgi:predicted flap endonuclease-1-like 5' DNA nuclease